MNGWIVIPASFLASLIGFVIGFYATIITSFVIGSSGENSIGVALHGIWMPVVALTIGGLLTGLLGGVVGTWDAKGTVAAIGSAWATGILALFLIISGTSEFETVVFSGAAMAMVVTMVAAIYRLQKRGSQG